MTVDTKFQCAEMPEWPVYVRSIPGISEISVYTALQARVQSHTASKYSLLRRGIQMDKQGIETDR